MATIFPTFKYPDARAAIDFLVAAFGFVEHAAYADDAGAIAHAELRLPDEDAWIMLGQEGAGTATLPFGPTTTYVVVADPDAHHAQAVAAGAEIVRELEDQEYGSREYAAKDPAGNVWSFGTYRPGRSV